MGNLIKPTVGRVVYLEPPLNSDIIVSNDGVCAALITNVHNNDCVNLAVFGANGRQHALCSVLHKSTAVVTVDGKNHNYYWDWMPYQKGQAAKTEMLEQKLCSGSVGCDPQVVISDAQFSVVSPDKSDSTKDAIIEQEIIDKGLIYPRVEKSRIDELMAQVRYDCHIVDGTTTTVITAILPITDHISFTMATEIMACVDPRNFNKELGEKYGIEKAANSARNKLWELEGYYLSQKLREKSELEAIRFIPPVQTC